MTLEPPPADAILDALSDGVLAVDARGRITRANPAAEELLGAAGLAGRALEDVGDAGRALARGVGRAPGGARGLISLGGRRVEVRVSATPDGGRVIALRTPGRVASIEGGEPPDAAHLTALAAGLAHELRNPLMGLMGAADLLRREAGEGGLAEYAEVIGREARRMEGLVRALLDVARPRAPDLQPLDVHRAVDEVLLVARGFAPDGVRFERRLDPSLPPLPADHDQLVQILLNLVRNAVEAAAPDGRVVVSTGAAIGLASALPAAGTHTLARITVSDSGPGFPPEVLESLYTPFSTTKAKGTGLGLVLCRRLVDAHGGLLEIRNAPEGGARVSVYLPTRRP